MYKYGLELKDRIPVLVKEREIAGDGEMLENPQKIADFMLENFRLQNRAEEQLWLLAFDTKMHVTGVFCVSSGTVFGTFCSTRSIFLRALATGASGIILVHNHPSGVTTPSEEDLSSAISVAAAGKLMEIKLQDFLIVGDRDYCSFLEQRLGPFGDAAC